MPNTDDRLRALEEAEQAVSAAFQTGRADRAAITKAAQDNAHQAVLKAGEAMEADEAADEAARMAVIAENMGDRSRTRAARKRARTARHDAKRAHRDATKSAKSAYEAIKFSQPGKLGFLRFVQVMYVVNIASTLAVLVMTSRDAIVYDSVTIADWISIILQGICFWFFCNYYKQTKYVVAGVAAYGIVASIITGIFTGTFSIAGTVINNLWNVFLIVYFLRSKRVRDVMVNDFSTYRPQMATRAPIRRHGWPFVRNLIMYFVVFSVLGHWMEAAMCQLIRLKLVQGEYDPSNTMLWRDWLYPYPMEGAAVVIIALALYPLWQYLLRRFERTPLAAYGLSFLANALTCSIIEFSMGLIVNADHQLWDYSDMFGNVMGQVCLQNAAAFGVAASLIAWVVYPLMERTLAHVPADTMNIAFVVVAVIGGILWSLYIIDPPESHAAAQDELAATQTKEQESYEIGLVSTEACIDALQDSIDESSTLTDEQKAEAQKQLDELNADLEGLKGTLADAGDAAKNDAGQE